MTPSPPSPTCEHWGPPRAAFNVTSESRRGNVSIKTQFGRLAPMGAPLPTRPNQCLPSAVTIINARADRRPDLTAFGGCEYCRLAVGCLCQRVRGHVVNFTTEFLQPDGRVDGGRPGGCAELAAGPRVPRRRYPGGGLSDRAGAQLHGPPGRGADRRAPPHPRVPFAPARRGEGDDRADPGRRHRSQPHQCGADRLADPRRQRAGAAVPVPLVRSPAQGARPARSATRSWPASSATVSSA